MRQENVQILWNQYVGGSYFRIGVSCSETYLNAKPGQFVMLRLNKDDAPLLSRPFSIHHVIIENRVCCGIELLIKVVGKFTDKLSQSRQGDAIRMLGPLGNHFDVSENLGSAFLVGGGVGVAPLAFLASKLLEKQMTGSITAFIGGRSEADILCRDHFASCQMPIYIATEDGTDGEKGMVTDLLKKHLDKMTPDVIYACGPEPMLRKIALMSKQYHIPCQVSVETVMACGIGACMGCAVETASDVSELAEISRLKHSSSNLRRFPKSSSYLHACIDGPVFDSDVLAF